MASVAIVAWTSLVLLRRRGRRGGVIEEYIHYVC